MLGAQFQVRALSGINFKYLPFADQRNDATLRFIPNPFTPAAGGGPGPGPFSSFHVSVRSGFGNVRRLRCRRRRRNSVVVSCRSSSGDDHDHDREFLPASLLISETLQHYRIRKHGLQEEMRWPSSGKLSPSAYPAKESRPEMTLIERGLLHRFQSPTIFLKVSCDGDYLLPIIVGEFAIEKLISAVQGDDEGDCPDQFQLVTNVSEKLGYEVQMVRITERVVNTYHASLYFTKPGENDVLSIDARPSDAINVAIRCKAPIYVGKQIVLTDAIRIGYGMGRVRDRKPTYDVSLDSAADGPDLLAEELILVRNMNLAVKEERYDDAAMWRDKLMELRKSKNAH